MDLGHSLQRMVFLLEIFNPGGFFTFEVWAGEAGLFSFVFLEGGSGRLLSAVFGSGLCLGFVPVLIELSFVFGRDEGEAGGREAMSA